MKTAEYHAIVVDDEPGVRRITARALAGEGISADLASDGVDALKQYSSERHDLVVTDLRMPNQHGHSMIVDLLDLDKSTSVFVLTGVAEPRLAKDLINRGVRSVDIKPINFKVFAAKIRATMNRDGETVPKERCNTTNDLPPATSTEMLRYIESALECSSESESRDRTVEWSNLEIVDDTAVPQAILDHVATSLGTGQPTSHELRKHPRIARECYAHCMCVDSDFHMNEEPFYAILRDISLTGISLLSMHPVASKYMAVAWKSNEGKAIRSVVEVVRCQPCGSMYVIGGKI